MNSLEDQQRLSEQQSRDLEEARQRERQLVSEQKKLETQCQEQDETIQNLSLNLSKVSKSMHDITLSRNNSPYSSSTPVRNARSEYFPNDEIDGSDAENGSVRPFTNQTNISHVTPMMRRDPHYSSSVQGDTTNLLENDQGSNQSYSEGNKYINTNYHYHNNTNNVDDRTINLPEGPPDNVGVVRPNNTRTVVDVEIPPEPIKEKPVPKKKKKGIMKVFKLCTGKSGQAMEHSKDDMYTKQPARVTMTTYTNESLN